MVPTSHIDVTNHAAERTELFASGFSIGQGSIPVPRRRFAQIEETWIDGTFSAPFATT
jgi:hypothetical protein